MAQRARSVRCQFGHERRCTPKVVDDGACRKGSATAYTETDLEGQTRLFSVGQYLDAITFAGGEPRFREKIAVCDTFNIPNLLAIPLCPRPAGFEHDRLRLKVGSPRFYVQLAV